MPKPKINPAPKDSDLAEAENQASAALALYLRSLVGRHTATARATGIHPPSLTRMSQGKQPITLDAAVLLDVASGGALRAEVLCPSRAKVLAEFLALRQPATVSETATA
jgi:DNA-binding transcriptional regulator YdaS (Cro superfamily)